MRYQKDMDAERPQMIAVTLPPNPNPNSDDCCNPTQGGQIDIHVLHTTCIPSCDMGTLQCMPMAMPMSMPVQHVCPALFQAGAAQAAGGLPMPTLMLEP